MTTRSVPVMLTALLAVASLTVTAAALTQDRINEYAARCLAAQIALRGVVRPAPAGETPARYNARIAGYDRALATVAKEIAPLARMPGLRDRSVANAARWARIASETHNLRAQIARKPKSPTAPAMTAQRLRLARESVVIVRLALRDARP
jgi:hypothetical protein